MGTGIFDMIFDVEKSKCPMCYKFVQPDTCGFNNTYYSFTGIKRDSMDKPPVKINEQEEVEVGDEYVRYNPDKSGKTQWLSLKIFTRRNQDKKVAEEKLCGVCEKAVKTEEKKEKCGHYYHDSCQQKLMGTCKVQCAMCYMG